jgi:hypothetical protein
VGSSDEIRLVPGNGKHRIELYGELAALNLANKQHSTTI